MTAGNSLSSRFPARATQWKLRSRALPLPKCPLVMGIVNVTPDSFSDGGRYLDPTAAVEHGLRLVEQGAALLDIGGESTRPYSEPLSADEELRRVLPVVEALVLATRVPISIDTSKAVVARAALDAGVEIINDVTALTGDPEMVPLAVETSAAVVAMHMRGNPQNMQDMPEYQDVVREVRAYLASRRDALMAAGIDRARIALDPGIGFGKTHQHNLSLAAHCDGLHELGCPLLLGPSRKGFIGKVLGNAETDRTFATLGVVLSMARQGVQVVRVHDVAAAHQALLLFEATGGIDGQENRLETS